MQKVPKHHVIAQGLIMRIKKKTFDALHPSQKKNSVMSRYFQVKTEDEVSCIRLTHVRM